MKTPTRIASLALFAFLITPLLAEKPRIFVGQNVDFSKLKTYQWLPPKVVGKTGIVENHPSNPVAKEAVDSQLSGVGMREVPNGGDLLVQILLTREAIPQIEAVFINTGDPMIYGTPTAIVGRYNKQGTLFINLIDSKTNKTAFAGAAVEHLPNSEMRPDELKSKLEKAAKKIFSKYPLKK